MALNKREKTLAWGVGALVVILVTDLWVIEPYFAQRAKLLRPAKVLGNSRNGISTARTR